MMNCETTAGTSRPPENSQNSLSVALRCAWVQISLENQTADSLADSVKVLKIAKYMTSKFQQNKYVGQEQV